MLVYGGIDEAGYGPMFGPLCVGSSVLVLNDYDPADGAPDMWELLQHIICKKRKDAKHKIAVNDSKQLKSNAKKKALTHLERGLFAFMSAMGMELPTCDTDFFKATHCATTDTPWYQTTTPLPVGNEVNMLRIDCSRLRRALQTANIECSHLECTAIDVEMYNKRTEHATKSSLNFSIAMQHVDRIVKKFPTQHPRIMIDRHGGKVRYRNDLQLSWPEAKIQVLIEDPSMSRYRIDMDGKLVTLTFASKTDEEHMPAALASMIAKYTRELMMVRFNTYFSRQIPEIKPTAGYVQDGRRFLKEIEPILANKGIKRELLVRSS